MILSYIGHLFLYFCFLSCGVGFFLNQRLTKLQLHKILLLVFCLTSASIILIIYAFYVSDYSLLIVANNSHHMMPLPYKITALWGNHEGSLTLFTWMVIAVNLLQTKDGSRNIYRTTLGISGCLILCIIFNSSPFISNPDYIKTGKGFNPLLQDIAIAFHPPILYLGNAIQLAIFIRIISNSDLEKIYILNYISWSLLTLGIALGSWWAYRELGWGGIWFWDPVENISLLPWLSSTIILHYKKLYLSRQYVIYACIASLSFILGMALLRSGIVTSVHSFAYDPSRGMLLLLLFILMLVLVIVKATKKQSTLSSDQSIPSAIKTNTLILTTIFLILLVGILYPIIHEFASREKIEISKTFFISTLTPIALVLIFAITWFTYKISMKNKKNIIFSVCIGLILGITIIVSTEIKNIFFSLVICASIILFIYSAIEVAFKRNFMMNLGHMLVALMLFSLTLHHLLSKEYSFYLQKDSPKKIENITIKLVGTEYAKQDNYLSRKAILQIEENNRIVILTPETRFYPIENLFTNETSRINHNILSEIYVVSGDLRDNSLMVEFKIQYMIKLIWLSAISMVLVGLYACFKKRGRSENE